MRLFVRLSLIGLIGLTALGYWLSQSQPQQVLTQVQVADGFCSQPGISITVDFGTNSEVSPISKCVANYQGNSWNLLTAAGIEVKGTAKYPIGFVCRLNNYPTETVEKCLDTPGAKTGSWAFFIAEDGKWKYSSFGASSHKARCGTSEGWRFLKVDEPQSTFPRATPVKTNCEK